MLDKRMMAKYRGTDCKRKEDSLDAGHRSFAIGRLGVTSSPIEINAKFHFRMAGKTRVQFCAILEPPLRLVHKVTQDLALR